MMAELWTRVCAESGARGHNYSLLHAMGLMWRRTPAQKKERSGELPPKGVSREILRACFVWRFSSSLPPPPGVATRWVYEQAVRVSCLCAWSGFSDLFACRYEQSQRTTVIVEPTTTSGRLHVNAGDASASLDHFLPASAKQRKVSEACVACVPPVRPATASSQHREYWLSRRK
jgi:hypothetical protein